MCKAPKTYHTKIYRGIIRLELKCIGKYVKMVGALEAYEKLL